MSHIKISNLFNENPLIIHMVEIWQLHTIFMMVFFGLPIGLALYKIRKWKRNGESIISQIKRDLNMDF